MNMNIPKLTNATTNLQKQCITLVQYLILKILKYYFMHCGFTERTKVTNF